MSEKIPLNMSELEKANGGYQYQAGSYYTYCMHDQYGLSVLGPYGNKEAAADAGKNWCQGAHDKGYTGTRYRVSYKTDFGWIDYDLISYPA